MNVLIVGGGGREHAIAWALSKSEQVEQLYCAPGNGGIAALAQCVPLSATDVDGVVAWAQAHSIDFVVVAPDDPLALGMVDALEDAGIPAFGPRADAAIIEASKIFSKNLMAKYHIPTAKYQTFTELAPALAYIEAEGAPIVVKAGQGRYRGPDGSRSPRGRPFHDGRPQVRPGRRQGGHRGVYDRPGGHRVGFLRRGASGSHALLPGSQAGL